jgi:hypothetical protein
MTNRLPVAAMLMRLPAFAGGQPSEAASDRMPAYIGMATMTADETIVLTLSSTDPRTGIHASGQFKYVPGNPRYDEVLRHLGGLRPGQRKPVPPWPD